MGGLKGVCTTCSTKTLCSLLYSFDETSRIKSVWGRGQKVIFCVFGLSSERINGQRAKTSRKLCASAFHLSKTRKKGTKSGRLGRPLCVRVLRVLDRWNALSRIFFEVFARRPLILSDETIDGSPLYCRRKELMACVRKPREKLCASAFDPSKTRQTRAPSGRPSRPLLVPFCRDLEE